jgi:response regulator of citrate/malate metabolism
MKFDSLPGGIGDHSHFLQRKGCEEFLSKKNNWRVGMRGFTYVTDEEILAVFEESEYPFVTAPEVAEEVGMTSAGVRNRLFKLVDDGAVETRKVGARARCFWLAEAE